MTDPQKPEDLTAQLAAALTLEWNNRHDAVCLCHGSHPRCRYPKPSALVAYEQGQAATPNTSTDGLGNPFPSSVWADLGWPPVWPPTHDAVTHSAPTAVPPKDWPNGPMVEDDGPDLPEPNAALIAMMKRHTVPALAYVLTRENTQTGASEVVKVYLDDRPHIICPRACRPEGGITEDDERRFVARGQLSWIRAWGSTKQ